MKPMIWKELRENVKWGVLVALLLGLVYTYFLSDYARNYNGYSRYNLDHEILPTLFTSPVAGLLIGLLQILPELRRDQWAFLVHRPVPRATLFRGKVIAGVAIYLGATLLPFGIAMFWLATSKRIDAPFDWRFMLAGLADTAGGIVFYFAGLLTAIRSARWYGSRATVIGAAVLCLIFMVQVLEFRQALLFGAGFGVVVLTAALGSFLTKGEYQEQPTLYKVALGATLFIGNMVCCCAAIAVIFVLFTYSQQSSPRTTTNYEIDKAGRIVRVTSTGGSIDRMTTLDGKPVPVPKSRPNVYGTHSPFLFQQSISYFLKGRRPSFRSPFRYYLVLNDGNETSDSIRWYYHEPDGLIEAYNTLYSRWEGYLTPDGFTPYENKDALSRTPRLSGDLLNWSSSSISRVLAFRDGAYLCDFEKRHMAKLVNANPGDPILYEEELFKYNYYQKISGVILVFTKNWIRGFSPEGTQLFTAPMEYRDKGYEPRAITMSARRDRWYIWYNPREQTLPSYVTEVTRGKSVTARYTLPPLPLPSEYYKSARQISLVGLLFGPGFVLGLTPLFGIGLPGIFASILSWSALAGFISTIPAYFIVRRYAFSKIVQWAWVFSVFLLGPFGVLLLLSLRAFPARKTCPACENPRVVERERCEHCGASWPAPARDGTEIFEDVRQRAA